MYKEKLCYVKGDWAYFTTQEKLVDQWGDDWDDAPYEHNAGEPYSPTIYHYSDGRIQKDPRDHNELGLPKWEIIKVAWDGNFDQPCDGYLNSPYSVQQINAGSIAWLRTSYHIKGEKFIVIPAGVDIQEFKYLIKQGGGNVYIKSE
jgi:hypothetical protein